MTTEHLYFITFCVGSLSEALHKSAAQVYSALRSSGVLNEYIIPCYDVLHTFSKEYIVQDLTEALKEKGYNYGGEEFISEGVADMHCRSDEYLVDELKMEYEESKNKEI